MDPTCQTPQTCETTSPTRALVALEDLSIGFAREDGLRTVVENVDLALPAGKTLALVGESGSGKTLLARALIGLLPSGAQICGGTIRIADEAMDVSALARLRGRGIGFIPQDPLSSLNPALKIRAQLAETMPDLRRPEADSLARSMLQRVQIRDPDRVLASYPHQLSGGMRQRVAIATALLGKPRLLIADEPTTALDLAVQAEILRLLRQLRDEEGLALLIITHDLSVAAELADTIQVIECGRIVETGPPQRVIAAPEHTYTRRLLAALPRSVEDAATPERTTGARIAQLDGICRHDEKGRTILRDIDLTLHEGEMLGLIGESGSGKTTLGRILAGVLRPDRGTLHQFSPIADARGEALPASRQFVFQDPSDALNPYMPVGRAIAEPLLRNAGLDRAARDERVARTMEAVGLSPALAGRLPRQLSGGQRQRVAIARAVVQRPPLIIADEPLSALDLSTQSAVIALLRELQRDIGFACLMISHDLAVVEQLADRVAILRGGEIVEIGPRAAVFRQPWHPYTRELLGACRVLRPDAQGYLQLQPRRFAPAPVFQAQAGDTQLQEIGPGHFVRTDATRTKG